MDNTSGGISYYLCDNCPCLQTDEAVWTECGLGFNNMYVVTNDPDPKAYSRCHTLSLDCGLIKIETEEETYYPEKTNLKPISNKG